MPSPWPQTYTPVGDNVFLSALVAGLPLYVLFYLLAVRRVTAATAALVSLTTVLFTAIILFGMPPSLAISAGLMGVAFGLFPIMWIVLNALFIYELTVDTGHFEVIRSSIAALSEDQRLQALLVAFAFGALVEGLAGFGTPVALSAAMMVGLGFERKTAVVLALLANTAPVAFGNLGIPVISLAGVIQPLLGAPRPEIEMALSAMVGRQIPLLSVIIPAFLVVALAGWKNMLAVWPAVVVAGVSFAGTQFITSNYLGPVLADVLAALVALVAIVALLAVWRPQSIWRAVELHPSRASLSDLGGWRILHAWSPFLILVGIIVIGSIPEIARVLDSVTTRIPWPGLHNQVLKAPPVVPPEAAGTPAALYSAVFTLDWLRSPGTLTLIAGLVSMAVLGVGPRRGFKVYMRTLWNLRWPIVAVVSVLALAWIMNYGGLTTTLGLFFTFTGVFFPLFSAFIGWIGVFLTGSDTASNNLFGGLQVTAAQQLGISPVLTAGTNSSGGVCGKMISPQNLAIGTASVGAVGAEGEIFRRTIIWSVGLAAYVGILAMLQAFVLTWMVPTLP